MKSTLVIPPPAPKPRAPFTYPCLLRSTVGCIVLASSPTQGVILVESPCYPVGSAAAYGANDTFDTDKSWELITTPIQITFTP